MIKVSVILPVYNTEKYLRQCLESIERQTLKEMEVFCVDDGSSDGSVEIIREYVEKDSIFLSRKMPAAVLPEIME